MVFFNQIQIELGIIESKMKRKQESDQTDEYFDLFCNSRVLFVLKKRDSLSLSEIYNHENSSQNRFRILKSIIKTFAELVVFIRIRNRIKITSQNNRIRRIANEIFYFIHLFLVDFKRRNKSFNQIFCFFFVYINVFEGLTIDLCR